MIPTRDEARDRERDKATAADMMAFADAHERLRGTEAAVLLRAYASDLASGIRPGGAG